MRYITIIMFWCWILTGCTTEIHPHLKTDFAKEIWQREVDTNPNNWLKGVDTWFLTGGPNKTELENRHAPQSAAISTISLSVHQFNAIQVDGAFQTQIFGADKNTVYLFGSNAATQRIAVDVIGHTLYIHQTAYLPSMRKVIVRIGIQQLNQLVQAGCGKIQAIQIRSNNLSVKSTAASCGKVFLSGKVNLTHVEQSGSGKIVILGACTPQLDVISTGTGSINLQGQLGVRSIKHLGSGDINIIGANTDGLDIFAEGSGKIGVLGPANIRKIHAAQNVCVYAYPLMSKTVKADICDNAVVGLAGSTFNLVVNAFQQATFYGQCLCTENAYIKAYQNAHVNVAASNKIFTSATDFASIYYFGPRSRLSSFTEGSAIIIPMMDALRSTCMIERPYLTPESNTMQAWRPLHAKTYDKSFSIDYSR